MELAIIAGLGALGYRFAAKGTSRRTQEVPPLLRQTNEFPFDTQVESRVLLDRDIQQAREHVMKVYDPASAQYVYRTERVGSGQAPELQPYLTSDRRAHVTNQRKLELFTGTDEAWQHRETIPTEIWKPEETRVAVGSGGSARSADPLYTPNDIVDRNVFGTRMNNVLPFAQQRVGPGLGVDPNVPATDGLHSQFRVLPTDAINDHMINQLPGRSTTGVAPITGGQRRYDKDAFSQNKPSLVEFTPQIGAGRAVVDAPAWMPMPEHKPTRAEGTSRELVGPSFVDAGSGPARVQIHSQKAVRQLDGKPWVAAGARVPAPKEYVTEYDKRSNLRDQPMPENTGAQATRFQQHVRDGIGEGIRTPKDPLDWSCQRTFTGASSTARGSIADGEYILKPTSRESFNVNTVGGGAVVGTGTARSCHTSTSGLRELSAPNAGTSSVLKKPQVQANHALGRGREAKGRVQEGSLPGGCAAGLEHTGRQRRPKNKPNAFDVPPVGVAKYAVQTAGTGTGRCTKKITSENPRAGFDSLGLGLFPECT